MLFVAVFSYQYHRYDHSVLFRCQCLAEDHSVPILAQALPFVSRVLVLGIPQCPRSRAMSDQEQFLRATVRVVCKCGRSADVKLQLKIGLDYPCLRARPNPYSGVASSLAETCEDTQVDPPDGNVMSIVGDLDVKILAVAAPDLSKEGTTVATMVATAGTTDATNAATTVATGVATDEKRQRRE